MRRLFKTPRVTAVVATLKRHGHARLEVQLNESDDGLRSFVTAVLWIYETDTAPPATIPVKTLTFYPNELPEVAEALITASHLIEEKRKKAAAGGPQ